MRATLPVLLRCPFCQGQIVIAASVCPHCRRRLRPRSIAGILGLCFGAAALVISITAAVRKPEAPTQVATPPPVAEVSSAQPQASPVPQWQPHPQNSPPLPLPSTPPAAPVQEAVPVRQVSPPPELTPTTRTPTSIDDRVPEFDDLAKCTTNTARAREIRTIEDQNLAWAAIDASPKRGQRGTLKTGPNLPALVASSRRGLDVLYKTLALGDKLGYEKLLKSGAVILLPEGTRVLVINGGKPYRESEVRILTGSHMGDSGWVPVEWVLPAL